MSDHCCGAYLRESYADVQDDQGGDDTCRDPILSTERDGHGGQQDDGHGVDDLTTEQFQRL